MAQRITYAQYLAAKKSIDDRSLNAGVWSRLEDSLPGARGREPTRVLEVGCGIGTMVERCLERRLLRYAAYTAIDMDPQLIDIAGKRLDSWGLAFGCAVERDQLGEITLTFPDGSRTQVNFVVGEALEFATAQPGGNLWDLIIAHATLDLVDLEVVPALLGLLEPQGMFYFSLIFDGLTAFLPETDPAFDRQITQLYHSSMDERRVDGARTGGSRSGRKILGRLHAEGARIIQAGASDWVITPHDGGYTADEGIFLQAILQTVHDELVDHPDLDMLKFKEWVENREVQIMRAELAYIAHQLDILGQRKR